MLGVPRSCLHTIVVALVLLAPARAQEASPAAPAQQLSLGEARAIIDGAIAYARAKNMRMGAAVVDVGGDLISGDRMDDASSRNVRFAEAQGIRIGDRLFSESL